MHLESWLPEVLMLTTKDGKIKLERAHEEGNRPAQTLPPCCHCNISPLQRSNTGDGCGQAGEGCPFWGQQDLSNSTGGCILINKRLPFTLESCTKDDAGRYVVIKECLFGENIPILNVYAPPGYPPSLITKAFLELAELDCAQSLSGGDFNCILAPHIAKSPAEGTNPTKQARATADVCEELGYLDVWRALNPNNKEFTFFSGVHKSNCRIDYLFVPKTMLYSVSSCEIGSITISDHAPVYLNFSHGEAQQRSNKWRFRYFFLVITHLMYPFLFYGRHIRLFLVVWLCLMKKAQNESIKKSNGN